jgi:hypothetical protein
VLSPPPCTRIFLLYFFFYYIIEILLGVHCDIYKSAYNISYLISPSPWFFIPLPYSWNSFNRSHFSIFIHDQILFPPYSPPSTISLYPPYTHTHTHCYQSQTGSDLCSCPPFLRKKKVSIWHIPKQFIPSIFLFYLSPLLLVSSTGLKILYSFSIESTSPIFTFFTSFFYLPPPVSVFLLFTLFLHCLCVFVGSGIFACPCIVPTSM